MQHRIHQKGLTLIEVMVGIVVGMLVILAASSAILVGHQYYRSTQASSALGQDSTLIRNVLDQTIRSAGTGFLHGNSWSPLGCTLQAKKGNASLIPLPLTAPAWLGSLLSSNQIPMAPVLIAEGTHHNHLLVSMSGSQQLGGAPQEIIDSDSAGTHITLRTSTGLIDEEMVLINASLPSAGATDSFPNCYLARIASHSGNHVHFDPSYQPATQPDGSTPMSGMAQQLAFISTLGHIDHGTLDMSAFGVNAQGELQQFNLITQDEPYTLAPNIVAFHAIYGLDDGAGNITWQPATGNYSYASILAKSRVERSGLLRNIAAIRVSLLIKNPFPQRGEMVSAPIRHFADVLPSAAITTTVASADKNHVHQLMEFSIPLRNALFDRNLVNAIE